MEINERVIAIVRLVVGLVVMAASACGLAIDADSVFAVIMCILAVAAFVYSWWKNNNITEAAQIAQGYLNALKDGAEIIEEDADEEDTEEAVG